MEKQISLSSRSWVRYSRKVETEKQYMFVLILNKNNKMNRHVFISIRKNLSKIMYRETNLAQIRVE